MTDRHIGYVVTLEGPVREDDSEAALNAIRMIKGVIAVEPVIDNPGAQMAYQKAKHDIERRLWSALRSDG